MGRSSHELLIWPFGGWSSQLHEHWCVGLWLVPSSPRTCATVGTIASRDQKHY